MTVSSAGFFYCLPNCEDDRTILLTSCAKCRESFNSTSLYNSELPLTTQLLLYFLLSMSVLTVRLFMSTVYTLFTGVWFMCAFVWVNPVLCDLLIPDPPAAVLKLGAALQQDEIKEGDGVYFECHLKSNPPHHKLEWMLNVSESKKQHGYFLECLAPFFISITKPQKRELFLDCRDSNFCPWFWIKNILYGKTRASCRFKVFCGITTTVYVQSIPLSNDNKIQSCKYFCDQD